jgi:PAS domain S-box-containing protein
MMSDTENLERLRQRVQVLERQLAMFGHVEEGRKTHERILEAIANGIERFLQGVPGRPEIEKMLKDLSQATGASRAYVLENPASQESLVTARRYAWIDPGLASTSGQGDLQALLWQEADFGRWRRVLGKGQLIYGHVRNFPYSEKSLLSDQDIRSILVVPIIATGKWWGIIGLDHCEGEREWSLVEIDAIKWAASILAAAILRQKGNGLSTENEEKYRLVIKHANEAILVAQDEMIKLANPKAEELTGYPIEDLTSKPFIAFIHPDDRALVFGSYLKRISGEVLPHVYQFRIIKRQGDIKWVEINAVLTTWDGRPATFNFLTDVTERKIAEDALRESEAQKRAILDASIDRIRHVDKDMRIIWANKTAAQSLGMQPDELVGRFCYQLFVDRDGPCPGCPTVAAQKSGRIERQILFQPKVKGVQGESFWDTYSVPIRNEEDRVVSFIQIARNITDQRKAEKALRESEERFRSMFAESPIGIEIYDTQGRLVDANASCLKIFGLQDASELRDYRLLDDPRLPPDAMDKLEKGETVRYEAAFNFNAGSSARDHAAGRRGRIHLDVSVTRLGREGRQAYSGYLVQVEDVTKRKRAEKQIRTLTHQLIMAQENERQRISRDLHDQVAQDLSTLRITCDTLFDDEPDASPGLRAKVSAFSGMLQEIIVAVRDLSYNLRPPSLDQLGLVQTIFQYCEEFSEKTGLVVDFYSAGVTELELSFDTGINLYRLIQEALNNISKHAEAKKIIIRLVSSFPYLILRIEDDGKGFNVRDRLETAFTERRMGIRSMQERVAILGGKMEIDSRQGRGTRVLIEVPQSDQTIEG